MEVLSAAEIQNADESSKNRFDHGGKTDFVQDSCQIDDWNVLSQTLNESNTVGLVDLLEEVNRSSEMEDRKNLNEVENVKDTIVLEQNSICESFCSREDDSSRVDVSIKEIAEENNVAELDRPEAMWAKWQGKWQACIRCSRADHPLSTLKAKPKNERKYYLVVFFPDTRTFSWVDAQLLHPIDEFPASITHDSRDACTALVGDLTLPHRFIMQKLGHLMLDISDQLHTKAVIRSARRVSTWKVFAKEASLCKEYSELGMMLLKLHRMILPEYIKCVWSEQSFDTWVKNCRHAESAEAIEVLLEELVASVVWADVDKLWNAQTQPTLSTEWRTWKEEVTMKFFTTLSGTDSSLDLLTFKLPLVEDSDNSRKRRKLDDQPKDITGTSDSMKSDSGKDELTPSKSVEKKLRQCMGFVEAKGRQCGRWANEGDNYCNVHLSHTKAQTDHNERRFKKCSAFVEAQGRLCSRWANEGDIYCSVHLSNHFTNKKLEFELTPMIESASMCKGMTKFGKMCKHHAQSGFSMCKKHQLKLDYDALLSSTSVSARKGSDDYRCIGHGDDQCKEQASSHSLYCQTHIPSFLKCSVSNENRILSEESFANALRSCSSRKEKIYLHKACEILQKFTAFSHGDYMKWVLDEAAGDLNIGEQLLKLVSFEREKISQVYGFATRGCIGEQSFLNHRLKCKICSEKFSDEKGLSAHWVEAHQKEALWLYRGFACGICGALFTNSKVQKTHIKESHGDQFLDDCVRFYCMGCDGLFAAADDLWEHVLSSHLSDFSLSKLSKLAESSMNSSASRKIDESRKYACKICGLKFDLLLDLGRHHQAAHLNSEFPGDLKEKKMKNPNLNRLGFRENLKVASTHGEFKKLKSFGMEKCVKAISSVVSSRLRKQVPSSQECDLGQLLESDCRSVADALFSGMKRTKFLPSNTDILAVAKLTCCRSSLHDTLTEKYGILPRNLCLKAAKLCSEANIQISWHIEGFKCPKECASSKQNRSSFLPSLVPLEIVSENRTASTTNSSWTMEESHYVLAPGSIRRCSIREMAILCDDISFGLESIPVPCVIDENLFKEHPITSSGGSLSWEILGFSKPWLGFSYATKRLLDPDLGLDTKSSQLGCACSGSKCRPETCDHVYLFDNYYGSAEDTDGNPMHWRFPYDEMGRILVEEGCLVYECNSVCSCEKTCQNRVLQHGLQVKLEVFRTERKGWAVRTTEAICRGRFICEYVGELLNDVEATRRGTRYDSEGCSYLYDVNAQIDGDDGRLFDGRVRYVIDATRYGNVARFINHSCSPNLVNYKVLVESMDCQLAHIGLYAARDIEAGEELSYDYRYKLLPGAGCPCYCGAPNCRGRLY